MVQERQYTGRFTKEICHDTEPEDRILNLSQLRSAGCLDGFRRQVPRYPDITRTALLDRAVAHYRELSQAQVVAAAEKAAKKSGRQKTQPAAGRQSGRNSMQTLNYRSFRMLTAVQDVRFLRSLCRRQYQSEVPRQQLLG